ncbi:MAG: TIGR03936 family radical SAM-associated protein [Lachnospiraceae bacterium]|nr:TIGR03936 family radical SAM-associated protein [Lachnospiraceae bacterium]
MKTRIKFSKGGVLRYIGHLDLMRYFQKAMRRADIPIAYSEGFHPHQRMAFALPLGVGMTSEGEYMDVLLDDDILKDSIYKTKGSDASDTSNGFDFKKACEALNQTMADGIRILEFAPLPEKSSKAMASVVRASYYVYFKKADFTNYDKLCEAQKSRFSNVPSMIIEKKTKKSVREVDLAPHIYEFETIIIDDALRQHMEKFLPDHENNGFLLNNGDPLIKLSLSHGSEENIKPDLFLSYLLQKDIDEVSTSIGCHRIELFMYDEEGALSPLIKNVKKQ